MYAYSSKFVWHFISTIFNNDHHQQTEKQNINTMFLNVFWKAKLSHNRCEKGKFPTKGGGHFTFGVVCSRFYFCCEFRLIVRCFLFWEAIINNSRLYKYLFLAIYATVINSVVWVGRPFVHLFPMMMIMWTPFPFIPIVFFVSKMCFFIIYTGKLFLRVRSKKFVYNRNRNGITVLNEFWSFYVISSGIDVLIF